MSDESCPAPGLVDAYGYAFSGCVDPGDPCTGMSRLYSVDACEGDDMPEWCLRFGDHPRCAEVATGEPPVPEVSRARELPATGADDVVPAVASVLVVGGLLLAAIAHLLFPDR